LVANAKRLAVSTHYPTDTTGTGSAIRNGFEGGGLKMKLQRSSNLLDKRLYVEVRRVLRLLERTRKTRSRVRLLIAHETGASRRKAHVRYGGAKPGR
jgi:hypothetical protein